MRLLASLLPGVAMIAAMPLVAAAPLHTSPELGKAEGQCRPDEPGPAVLVSVVGLKDMKGHLKLEIYPPNERDFLEDDNILLNQGKTFRRVEVPTVQGVSSPLCIRVPAPGAYTLLVLHDRDSNHKFGLSSDGIGFASNPRIGWSKPKAANCLVQAGPGLTRINVVMNYRHGLFSLRPLRKSDARR